MKPDFDTIRRQFLTCERALRNCKDDSPALANLQKTYDEAKERYEAHPQHPKNVMARQRGDTRTVEKKF